MPIPVTDLAATSKAVALDALVVGAGFAGLYMLHMLRDKLELKVEVIEAAHGVGGTWYWNRYPGARCDIPSHHYSYSFSPELEQQWNWSEKYASQTEILAYLEFVADKFDLRRNISFGTRVEAAHFDEPGQRWKIRLSDGRSVAARFFIPAVGTLSDANIPQFKAQEKFAGQCLITSKWPAQPIEFAGKRVAIIGTGATAMQLIPEVAKQAAHLTVFQRTPNYGSPLRNEPMDAASDQAIKAEYRHWREQAWNSFAGVPFPRLRPSAVADTAAERQAQFEACWQDGGFSLWIGSYGDVLTRLEANRLVADFVREKIRARVKNAAVAELLCPPTSQTYGTKRQPCESGYYETFDRDNVSLVDIRKSPIEEFTVSGLRTTDKHYDFDILIYATGFDAFTGALHRIDIRGRDALPLKRAWSHGPRTLYGLGASGFPNMFLITGPQSPSVLFNMPLGIEMHVEWIADCIRYLDEHDLRTIEARTHAEDAWLHTTKEIADSTLLPDATSWYLGANVAGKPRVFMVYLGGGKQYREIIRAEAEAGYPEFLLR